MRAKSQRHSGCVLSRSVIEPLTPSVLARFINTIPRQMIATHDPITSTSIFVSVVACEILLVSWLVDAIPSVEVALGVVQYDVVNRPPSLRTSLRTSSLPDYFAKKLVPSKDRIQNRLEIVAGGWIAVQISAVTSSLSTLCIILPSHILGNAVSLPYLRRGGRSSGLG